MPAVTLGGSCQPQEVMVSWEVSFIGGRTCAVGDLEFQKGASHV
jgi:hypothetical protein